MSEIITNKQVENNIDEQMKPILTDMLKYSPSKIVGFLGNLIVVPIYTHLLTTQEYGLMPWQLLHSPSCA